MSLVRVFPALFTWIYLFVRLSVSLFIWIGARVEFGILVNRWKHTIWNLQNVIGYRSTLTMVYIFWLERYFFEKRLIVTIKTGFRFQSCKIFYKLCVCFTQIQLLKQLLINTYIESVVRGRKIRYCLILF